MQTHGALSIDGLANSTGVAHQSNRNKLAVVEPYGKTITKIMTKK